MQSLVAPEQRRTPAIKQALNDVAAGIDPAGRVVDDRYQTDPLLWIVERMRIPEETIRWSMNPGYEDHKWDGDEDPFVKVLEAVGAGKWVAIESGTGVGKTYLAALLALWFVDVFENSEAVTIAPTKRQLLRGIWKEIGKLYPLFKRYNPRSNMVTLHLRMKPKVTEDDWHIFGFGASAGSVEESAGTVRGFHGKHLFFLNEEMSSQHIAVIAAIEYTLTGGLRNQWFGFGNPNHTSDPLHTMCERDDVVSVRISGLDHPNVVMDNEDFIPGAVTNRSIQRSLNKAGGDEDDQLYKAMVQGICPTDIEHGLIKRKWLAEAMMRAKEMPDELRSAGPKALGVDVADSEKGDKGAIAEGHGALMLGIEAFKCPDANVLGTNVVTKARAEKIAGSRIGVDAAGIGGATINEAKRLKYPLVALHGAASPLVEDDEEIFFNLRSQMWYQLRRDLKDGIIGIDFKDEELFRELLTVRFENRNGKIYVESKKDLVKRLGHSPDKADAMVYWNWVRARRGPQIQVGRA